MVHPKRIELLPQAPEACVLSIGPRVQLKLMFLFARRYTTDRAQRYAISDVFYHTGSEQFLQPGNSGFHPLTGFSLRFTMYQTTINRARQ